MVSSCFIPVLRLGIYAPDNSHTSTARARATSLLPLSSHPYRADHTTFMAGRLGVGALHAPAGASIPIAFSADTA
jgi:hypothetical protein